MFKIELADEGVRGDLIRLKFGGIINSFAIRINVRCLLEGALDISTVLVGAPFFSQHIQSLICSNTYLNCISYVLIFLRRS